MKKYFIMGAIIVFATIGYNINFSQKDVIFQFMSDNVEALAGEESGGSGLRGTCMGNVGPCISYCPSCNRAIKGTSGKKGPLENIHGTCVCGQKF